VARRRGEKEEEGDLGGGSLFATGLVAGGALTGVVVALLQVNDGVDAFIQKTLNMEPRIASHVGESGYQLLGVGFFAAMALLLYRTARRSSSRPGA